MERVYAGIERSTGVRPRTGCPWRTFNDPLLVEVLRAFRACAGGMGVTPALLLPSDPPHAVWDGVQEYAHLTAKVREYEDDLREQKRKQKEKRRHG